MCGIAGILGSFSESTLSGLLPTMLRAQAHRGPDDEGKLILGLGNKTLALGHRRLAILDPSPMGHQPMVNADTGDVLVYNGETYNSPELRRELECCGFRFTSRSDTEVILRGYQRWGLDCLDRLRGMFALALWDSGAQRLLLARDHLGIKPLYYIQLGSHGFLFASEIRSALASGLIEPTIDARALAGYFAYGSTQEPLSIVRGLRVVARAGWMQIEPNGTIVATGRYWHMPSPEPPLGRKAGNEIAAEGRALLEQSVKRHLLSDVPVGVFLSSGLDSTAVLGLAREVSAGGVHAFTVAFPDDADANEAPEARAIAARLDCRYHECPIDSQTALGWVEQGLASMDQPAMDGLNTYMVARAVREQNITVALSGQGGDEVFGGYRSFRSIPRWQKQLRWLAPLPQACRAGIVSLATFAKASTFREKARDLAASGTDFLDLYFHSRRLLSEGDFAALGFTAAALDLSPSYHLPTTSNEACFFPSDPTATISRLEMLFYLGNTLLHDSDVFGMANSLEIRLPFLDRDLLDWAYRLPGTMLLPDGKPEKSLLRDICANYYSESQLRQAKRGFTPPVALWLLGPLRETMEECCGFLERSGLVDPRGVARIKARFLREPQSPAWSRLWSLVTMGSWLMQLQGRTMVGKST